MRIESRRVGLIHERPDVAFHKAKDSNVFSPLLGCHDLILDAKMFDIHLLVMWSSCDHITNSYVTSSMSVVVSYS